MPVTINEVIAEVEPSQPEDKSSQERQTGRPSPKADLRQLRMLEARLDDRRKRVRAD